MAEKTEVGILGMKDISPSERLIRMVDPASSGALGVSAEDIAKIPASKELYSTVLECLQSKREEDLVWGLFFSEALLARSIPSCLLVELRRRLPLLIKDHREAVREMAVPLFVALRNEFADYRERMLDCLKDPSPEVRFQALTVFQTFLSRKDISSLLHFQHDNYLAETEMGSPLVYALRNQALAVIESLCGKEFRKTEKVVMLVSEERIAYCWDWQPFLNWWKKEGSKWRFWRQ